MVRLGIEGGEGLGGVTAAATHNAEGAADGKLRAMGESEKAPSEGISTEAPVQASTDASVHAPSGDGAPSAVEGESSEVASRGGGDRSEEAAGVTQGALAVSPHSFRHNIRVLLFSLRRGVFLWARYPCTGGEGPAPSTLHPQHQTPMLSLCVDRCPASWEQFQTLQAFLSESQGQNLALTVLHVPYSLNSASDTGAGRS